MVYKLPSKIRDIFIIHVNLKKKKKHLKKVDNQITTCRKYNKACLLFHEKKVEMAAGNDHRVLANGWVTMVGYHFYYEALWTQWPANIALDLPQLHHNLEHRPRITLLKFAVFIWHTQCLFFLLSGDFSAVRGWELYTVISALGMNLKFCLFVCLFLVFTFKTKASVRCTDIE